MVVYVDGKPIFVQNSKGSNNSIPQQIQQKLFQQQQQQQQIENQPIANKSSFDGSKQTIRATKIKASTLSQQSQITKIPYLLAAAAAATNPSRCTIGALKKEKNDHEYQHLVSLFKQKNEKLFNPLANSTQNDAPNTEQNNSVC